MTELIPQPHGGALLPGGKPGNRGGGNIKSRAREAAAEGGYTAIKMLGKVLRSIDAEIEAGVIDKRLVNELSRALEALGKYGLGEIQAVVESEAIFHAFKDSLIEHQIEPSVVASILGGVKDRLGS